MAASVVSAVADAIATSDVVHVFAIHDVIKNECAHDVSVMHFVGDACAGFYVVLV